MPEIPAELFFHNKDVSGIGRDCSPVETYSNQLINADVPYCFIAHVGTTLSRINHRFAQSHCGDTDASALTSSSCSWSPPVHTNLNMPSLHMEIRASRDIKAGEQLLLAYSDLLVPQAERQKRLDMWCFTANVALA